MRILRRKSDNVVLAVGSCFDLSESGVTVRGVHVPFITTQNADIVDVDSIPEHWANGFYTFDTDWELTPAGRNAIIAIKTAEIAAMRYDKEISGVEIDGQLIHTDLMSQLKLTMATVAAMLDSSIEINWKGKDGTWKAKDATAIMQTFGQAVAMGEALFNAEKAKTEAIANDPTTDINEGWPI